MSYEQFILYCENTDEINEAFITINQELMNDEHLFNRLNKQSWIDMILQSYKVFILESCFFECVCISMQHRNIVNIIIDWFNNQIEGESFNLVPKNKIVNNLTSDMSDCVAFTAAILNYCPFIKKHFSIFCEIDEFNKTGCITHNACLLIEALNQIKLYFPLNCEDLLQPNFLQMLFLSVHLFVVLPTYKTKDIITFNPPLLRSSTRQISVYPSSQESLTFNYIILNNFRNNFTVEKAPSNENGKKVYINIKYEANFIDEINSILLIHGFNKTRIFDTYMVFLIKGCIGSLTPHKKCKIMCPLYRPNKVDILVSSPFSETATFNIYILDNEPAIPLKLEDISTPRFFVRRLSRIDKIIVLNGIPKEAGQEISEHKLFLQMTCLSVQVGSTWIWFRSELGEFFIKVNTQPRLDLPLDMLQVRLPAWPLQPCSCTENCECYRTTVLMIPHKNDLMVKSLRYALLENASDTMLKIYDQLIGKPTFLQVLNVNTFGSLFVLVVA